MKKLSEITHQKNKWEITFGTPEDIEFGMDTFDDTEYQILPIIVNGVEYTKDDIYFEQDIKNYDGVELNRVDIRLAPELQHKGLGFAIYKKYIQEMGNIIDIKAYRHNEIVIPKLFAKLATTSGITVVKQGDNYFAYDNEWGRKHNANSIDLTEIDI